MEGPERPQNEPEQRQGSPFTGQHDSDEAIQAELERREVVRGAKPGTQYVRRQVPHLREFRSRGEGILEATERALRPTTSVGRAYERARRFLLGERIPSAQEIQERLTKVKALAVLSSDAISSVAYGTEASLAILITAGAAALHYNLIIAACIAVLMIVVGLSYRQTVHAYPRGGGSYIVARDNLGTWPGLVAAASILIDYVLTVSVSVSSGVDALVSAFRPLGAYSVELGVGVIVVIMLINLRGIRESGSIFAAPTYAFITCFLIMIITGVVRAAFSPGGLLGAIPPAANSPQVQSWHPETFSVFLILTAFASGCSAMTGVEAISDGVPAFKPPESHNAARTLEWMIAILVTLFLGITYLAWRYGIEPFSIGEPTVTSQIAGHLFNGGFGWFFYVIQFATMLILVLAANTSFSDFPRLSSILARDGFMPRQFAYRGDRLAFSTGIIALSVLSTVLMIAFKGNTVALINLYALGVFTAFTLSQSGMVRRWYRLREQAGPKWQRSMAINLVGAVTTGIVAIVIMIAKFDRGAWIVVVLVPILVVGFSAISRHYEYARKQTVAQTPTRVEDVRHIVIVPIADLNRPALQSLAYARSITGRVLAVHVSTDEGHERVVRDQWQRWLDTLPAAPEVAGAPPTPRDRAIGRESPAPRRKPQLVIIESPYRSLIGPLVAYVDAVRDDHPEATISVILPEYVPAHWWERILHNQSALRLKLALYSHPRVVVVNVPYHLRHTETEPATVE